MRGLGEVLSAETTPTGLRLRVGSLPDLGPVAEGDSIAVDGVCLTVAEPPVAGVLAFDVVPETLRLTTLGGLAAAGPVAPAINRRVNLEPSLRFGDPVGGHLVSGHVTGVGTVREIDRTGGQWLVRIACPAGIAGDLIAKGSVAVDGVSLTLVDVWDDGFSVALIPTTLRLTTLGLRRSGDAVNLEPDPAARMMRTMLERMIGPAVGRELERRARDAPTR